MLQTFTCMHQRYVLLWELEAKMETLLPYVVLVQIGDSVHVVWQWQCHCGLSWQAVMFALSETLLKMWNGFWQAGISYYTYLYAIPCRWKIPLWYVYTGSTALALIFARGKILICQLTWLRLSQVCYLHQFVNQTNQSKQRLAILTNELYKSCLSLFQVMCFVLCSI